MSCNMKRGWLATAWLGCVLWGATVAQAQNWPSWRGPREDGTSTETNLPQKWSKTEGVKWKAPLPDAGNATPIIWGDKVFVVQAVGKGAKRGVMCFNQTDGKQLWFQTVPGPADAVNHKTNPYCSSSPVTDGQAVYAWLDLGGAVAYDLEGKQLWHKEQGEFEHIWGFGTSPVLYQDTVIMHCGPGKVAFVVALDKKTGEQKWKIDAPTSPPEKFYGSWSPPKIIRQDNRDLLLISHPKKLVAYDPAKGTEIWSCEGLTDLVYTTPLYHEGIAVAMSGYHGKALATRTNGTGNITEKLRLWNTPQGQREQQRIGSGIIHNGNIIMVNETGVESINLESGESQWQSRLGRKLWSSLVLADGRFYVVDQSGTTHVFNTSSKLDVLETNSLDETTNASIAISQGNIFIRTYDHLWCIGK